MRLIDADALVKELSDKYIVPVDEASRGVAAFMGMQTRQAINNAPTIDAEPTKHGRWILNSQYGTECSECGTAMFEIVGAPYTTFEPNYCPNCGARMDESEAEE